MANGRRKGSSYPWYGCALFHAPSFRDDFEYYCAKVEEVIDDKITIVKHRKRNSLFPSASARDLRYVHAEKENRRRSSPRGILEADLHGVESDPDSLEDSALETEDRACRSRALSHWSKFFKLLKGRSFMGLTSLPPLGVLKTSKRMMSRSGTGKNMLSDLCKFKSSLVNFSLADLQNMTGNFSQENLIGKGGYADVYKGCLEDGQLVAVKRLMKGTLDERTAGFLSELGIIAHIDHPNTAKLIGSGIEGGMHLVFKLSQNGSLGSFLHGLNRHKLEWSKRYKIALGTADGLLYLHENCRRRIIHRDIKADNVLLTEDFEAQLDLKNFKCNANNKFENHVAKICDFGLAKWLPKQWTHYNVSKFEGTFGYFAPEYFMHGIVDEKTDIYSFGVLLLELITGRPALDDHQQSLVIWAKPLLDKKDYAMLVDPSLGESYNHDEMEQLAFTASSCLEQSPVLRPCMSQVVVLLRGDKLLLECTKARARATLQRTYSEELLDAREYNKTKYFSDLDKHKQLALGS